MSSLAFIPRNLSKPVRPKTTEQATRPDNKDYLSSSTVPAPPAAPAPDDLPAKYSDQDYANLIALSLSDYALWIDSDLRKQFDIGTTDEHRYVSLDYLFEQSYVLSSLLGQKKGRESPVVRSRVQAALVKGVRTHANEFLDVRLLLHSDVVVPRFGKQKDVSGGYEIKRKHKGLSSKSKSDWDACTLYLENIPPGHRSYAEIIRFLSNLLHEAPSITSSSALPADPLTRIQGISFPLHFNDKPGTRPTCKGFALVVFAHASDSEYLRTSWPWVPSDDNATEANKRDGKSKQPKTPSEIVNTAIQYQFRVTTKKRWLEFKAEYLAYRQQLVEEINAYEDARRDAQAHLPQESVIVPAPQMSNSKEPAQFAPLMPLSPYPPGCLLLVKNVHPDTTKTTLRALFSQAFHSLDQNDVEGLGYVDFNKGMDKCHLRLAAPKYTNLLVHHFNHHLRKVIQVSGIDECGVDIRTTETPVSKDLKPIIVERVVGRPEEIYWERIPAKVRKNAVEQAIQLMAPAGVTEDCNERHNHVRKRNRDRDDNEVEDGRLTKKKSRIR